jgi:hypothetical protein
MANDFDQFPVYDDLVKVNTRKMSDIWVDFISTFYMNLIGYLSQNGIFLPPLTTAQRDAIQSPQNGQMIYNTTIGSAQYFKAGTWTSF